MIYTIEYFDSRVKDLIIKEFTSESKRDRAFEVLSENSNICSMIRKDVK